MELNKIASAILNDLWGGNLIPASNRSLISIEQMEDEIIEERYSIIHEYYLKNALKKHDLSQSINCIKVDCKDPSKCPCGDPSRNNILHFEIPKLVDGLGSSAVIYIGSTDHTTPYKVYYTMASTKFQKYKFRKDNKPYVYLDTTPNANGMIDGWIFNAPFVKTISVTGIFSDPRDLEKFNCCDSAAYLDMGSISSELIRRILAKKVNLYRAATPATTQTTG